MDNLNTPPKNRTHLYVKKPFQHGWKSNLVGLFSIVALAIALCPNKERLKKTLIDSLFPSHATASQAPALLPAIKLTEQPPPLAIPAVLTQEQRDRYYIVVEEYTVRHPLRATTATTQPETPEPSLAQTIENVSNPTLEKKKERLRSDITEKSVARNAHYLAKLCTPLEEFLGYQNGNLAKKYLAIGLIENSMNLEDPFQNNLGPFASQLFEQGPDLIKRLKEQPDLIVGGVNYNKGDKLKLLKSTVSRLTGDKNDLLDPKIERAVTAIKNDIVFAVLITELHHAKYSPQALEAIKNDKGNDYAAVIEKAIDYSTHQIGGPKTVEMSNNLEKPAKKFVPPHQLRLYGANKKTTCEGFLLLVANFFKESEQQIRENWDRIQDLEPARKMGAKSREKLPSADHS